MGALASPPLPDPVSGKPAATLFAPNRDDPQGAPAPGGNPKGAPAPGGNPQGAPAPGGNVVARLTALIDRDLQACNRAIVERMDSPVALIPQLAAHIVAAGGKRLRPMLTLAAARMCGYSGERHIRLAACVEFIHTATLLHDDVVDESVLRRGLASANALFGNQPSVLVGDFLFARAFQLMVEDGSLPVLAILSRAAATIAEGEVLQLTTQNDLSTSVERHLDVIRGKTAALFAAACQVPGVVPTDLSLCLPDYVVGAIREALPVFARQIRGLPWRMLS